MEEEAAFTLCIDRWNLARLDREVGPASSDEVISEV